MKNATVLLALTAALTLSSCTSGSTNEPSLETKLIVTGEALPSELNLVPSLITQIGVDIRQIPELKNQKITFRIKGPAGWNGDQIATHSVNVTELFSVSKLFLVEPKDGQYDITLESEKLPVMKRSVIIHTNTPHVSNILDFSIVRVDGNKGKITWKRPSDWQTNEIYGYNAVLYDKSGKVVADGYTDKHLGDTIMDLVCKEKTTCFNLEQPYDLKFVVYKNPIDLYNLYFYLQREVTFKNLS